MYLLRTTRLHKEHNKLLGLTHQNMISLQIKIKILNIKWHWNDNFFKKISVYQCGKEENNSICPQLQYKSSTGSRKSLRYVCLVTLSKDQVCDDERCWCMWTNPFRMWPACLLTHECCSCSFKNVAQNDDVFFPPYKTFMNAFSANDNVLGKQK